MKHLWISDETHLSQNSQVLVGLCQHLCISDKTHLSRTTQMWVGLCQHLFLTKRICLRPLRCGLVSVSTCVFLTKMYLSWNTQVLVHIITSFCLTVHICVKPAITWILICVRLSVPVSQPYPGKYKNIKCTGSTRECCSYGCYSLTPVRPSKFMVDKMLRLKEKSKPAGHFASAHHPQAALQLKMFKGKVNPVGHLASMYHSQSALQLVRPHNNGTSCLRVQSASGTGAPRTQHQRHCHQQGRCRSVLRCWQRRSDLGSTQVGGS